MRFPGAYFELDVICCGTPDPESGYVMDIRSIDRSARETAIAAIGDAFGRADSPTADTLLAAILEAMSRSLGPALRSIRWHLTRYHWMSMSVQNRERVLVSQEFEFAAAHRLFLPALNDEENLQKFGKCSNANGHGHNYRLRVVISRPAGEGPVLSNLDRIVHTHVIERFDHKHLNLDTDDFRSRLPTVENIARTCFELLQGPINQIGGTLELTTVWETEKTSATYPAGATW